MGKSLTLPNAINGKAPTCKRPLPVSDHLGLTFWVVAY